jgi:predicted exporter
VARVLTPVFAAVMIELGVLVLLGQRLTLFHLVSLLLVVGIGLNYALFFNRPQGSRTLTALLVCGMTTISAFGCLAFSATPVLHAIGLTVALGAVLSLVTTAAMSRVQET